MTYQRSTYIMSTLTLTVPTLDNSGQPHDIDGLRLRLLDSFTGWTEVASMGCWLGKLEPGTVFTFYVSQEEAADLAQHLGSVGREFMPDQEAVQVTIQAAPITLIEA